MVAVLRKLPGEAILCKEISERTRNVIYHLRAIGRPKGYLSFNKGILGQEPEILSSGGRLYTLRTSGLRPKPYMFRTIDFAVDFSLYLLVLVVLVPSGIWFVYFLNGRHMQTLK